MTPIVAAQVGAADYSELQAGGESFLQTPEIQGLLQNKKTSCYGKQNVQEIKKWAKLDLSQDDLSTFNSKNLCNLLFEQLQEKLQGCSKKELFLALFDLMDSDEQNDLLAVLQERVLTAAETSR